MTPYEALYGQAPPQHLLYLAGSSTVDCVDRSLQQQEVARHLLRYHLKRAQDRMKHFADRRRSDHTFQVSDWVYLKLQPYRQHSLRKLVKVGTMAYTLQLLTESRIHPTFHVSQLKCHVGKQLVQSTLPLEGLDGMIPKEPIHVLDRCMVKRDNQVFTEVFIEWANTFPKDATWEVLHELRQWYPAFDP